MNDELEVVAYLFDYENERGDETLVPLNLQLSKDDPRTSDRWSHVEVTEIYELVKKEDLEMETDE